MDEKNFEKILDKNLSEYKREIRRHQKVDVEEFEHFTKRLISLEKKVRALQN